MTSTTTTGPTTTGLKATSVVESLTGYDELKIEQQFGAPVEALGGAKFIRALLFGHFLHQGMDAKAAHRMVMGFTQAEVGDYFADEEDDDDAPDPSGAGAAAAVDGAVVDEAGADAPPVVPRRPIADAPQA